MQIETPFDVMAKSYDADFTWSQTGWKQRAQVRSLLLPHFTPRARNVSVLEMNCGTGEDAFWLRQLGYKVVATDSSTTMIEVSRAKQLRMEGEGIQFLKCKLENLGSHFHGSSFDRIFSNFGGINCLSQDQIQQLASELHDLLAPGGVMALVVMGRFCLWETGYYFMKGKWKTAFRRSGENVLAAGNSSLPFYHYTPAKIIRLMTPFFTHVATFPVGLLLPPSYLERSFIKRPLWLNRLDRWEGMVNRFEFLSGLADHFCIVFKQTEI